MTEDKNIQDTQELIEQMRANALEEAEDAPSVIGKRRGAKEIKTKRSPWVLRSLIVVLFVAVLAEGYLIIRHQRTVPEILIHSAPPIAAMATPTIENPFPTPPIEGYEEAPPDLPEPVEAPWPEGVPTLEAIEFPEPEE
ncbi:MAG: hypothetical protein H8E28_15530 [Anaerolineae bacterium]|nr:hypothetical protein [Anaerolineae bacterium]